MFVFIGRFVSGIVVGRGVRLANWRTSLCGGLARVGVGVCYCALLSYCWRLFIMYIIGLVLIVFQSHILYPSFHK